MFESKAFFAVLTGLVMVLSWQYAMKVFASGFTTFAFSLSLWGKFINGTMVDGRELLVFLLFEGKGFSPVLEFFIRGDTERPSVFLRMEQRSPLPIELEWERRETGACGNVNRSGK